MDKGVGIRLLLQGQGEGGPRDNAGTGASGPELRDTASMSTGVILSRQRGGNGMGEVLSQMGGKGVLFPVSGGFLEARDAAYYPIMHRTAPTSKNHLLAWPLLRASDDGAFFGFPKGEVRIPDGRRRVRFCCQEHEGKDLP